MDFIAIAAGLVVLVAAGDALVRGAAGLASRLGVSPLLVGLVVVGFGTSAPELTTSVSASLAGAPGVAVGNVVGSNVANILLILGLSALLAPIAVKQAAFRRDGAALAAATLLSIALLLLAPMNRLTGAAMVLALLAYIALSYGLDRRSRTAPAAALHEAEAQSVVPPASAWLSSLLLIAGLAGVVGGAWLLVQGAVSLATGLGVSQALIGLTVVAVSTSLPELAASLSAARKGQSDIAFGNIIGSNIFNALGILGAAAISRPFDPPASILGLDVWAMAAATALLILFALTGARIDRREGAILLALYAGYVVATAALSSAPA